MGLPYLFGQEHEEGEGDERNKVYVYGDCAINVSPNAEELAAIAVASAQTAKSFGIKPRVALLSYATGDSNTGEQITKVSAEGPSQHHLWSRPRKSAGGEVVSCKPPSARLSGFLDGAAKIPPVGQRWVNGGSTAVGARRRLRAVSVLLLTCASLVPHSCLTCSHSCLTYGLLVREGTARANEIIKDGPLADVPIEGPLQFDAAVDPEVAKVKVKTPSEVAGRANVCIFPDLNTGNNAYKAVQQASDCIAMGPIMQVGK
eukprot:8029117-Pyramimonas_sp.AAC.1